MGSKILIITHKADGHLRFVSPYLGSEALVIDPLDVTNGVELSFTYYRGNKIAIKYGRKNIDKVTAVWYRKPVDFRELELPVSNRYKDYALSSLSRHCALLRVQFPDALWVSDYYAIARAEIKTLQYRIAATEGLHIPETLFTSSEDAARRFIDRHEHIVVKSLALYSPSGTTFPTTMVHNQRPIKLNGLKLAPAVFQVAIQPMVELRVTVIGRSIFAASIVDRGNKDFPAIRDWRYDHHLGKIRFESYVLSTKIQQACLNLVKKLGLQFGAIDLVVDKKGKVWFLEINPNGQWAFIEQDTGLPLGKSLAELLTGTVHKL